MTKNRRKALGRDPLGKRGTSKIHHIETKRNGPNENYYTWIEGMVGKKDIKKKVKPKRQEIVKSVRSIKKANKTEQKVAQRKKLVETHAEAKKSIDFRHPVCKTAATTATATGVGVIGALTTVAVAAAFKVALPVGLCVWAGGVAFGGVGLALGLCKKKKSSKKRE